MTKWELVDEKGKVVGFHDGDTYPWPDGMVVTLSAYGTQLTGVTKLIMKRVKPK